jgi:hypothetical protein
MSETSNWGQFKATAHDVGSWLWGTAQGGFNEKQTIGQVCTDAVISMIPIAGEITAVRDVAASSIRLCEYPEKREETMEWVLLILPLLAIIPLFGGALKGVGKLLLRAGKNAAEDKKILEACIYLLNKVGHGNAVRFLKELDFMKYNSTLVNGINEALTRISKTIEVAQQKLKDFLPQKVFDRFTYLREQLAALKGLASKMVPQALKDLNNRLKYIQKLMYEGEWHAIPGAGKHITRETEARLVNKAGKMEWELKEAKFPQNAPKQFKKADGWPDLMVAKYTDGLDAEEEVIYRVINSFSGEMRAVDLAGNDIYRVIDYKFGRSTSEYWMYLDPKSIKGYYWRVKFAVLQRFSHNGKYVKFSVPNNKRLLAWEGRTASQIDNDATRLSRDIKDVQVGNDGFGQYLEGGETQLFIDFEFEANKWAKLEVGELAKLDTNWVDHMNINLVPTTADVQKIGAYVEEEKTLAAANLAMAANQAGKAVRYGNQK